MDEGNNDTGGRKGFSEVIDIIIDEAKVAASHAYKRSESITKYSELITISVTNSERLVTISVNRIGLLVIRFSS